MNRLFSGTILTLLLLFLTGCGQMDTEAARKFSAGMKYKITISVNVSFEVDPGIYIKANDFETGKNENGSWILIKGASYLSMADVFWGYLFKLEDVKILVPLEGKITIEKN